MSGYGFAYFSGPDAIINALRCAYDFRNQTINNVQYTCKVSHNFSRYLRHHKDDPILQQILEHLQQNYNPTYTLDQFLESLIDGYDPILNESPPSIDITYRSSDVSFLFVPNLLFYFYFYL